MAVYDRVSSAVQLGDAVTQQCWIASKRKHRHVVARTHAHLHRHTNVHTHTHAGTHMHACTDIHKDPHTHIDTHIHKNTYGHTCKHAHTCPGMNTHTCMHVHTPTHTLGTITETHTIIQVHFHLYAKTHKLDADTYSLTINMQRHTFKICAQTLALWQWYYHAELLESHWKGHITDMMWTVKLFKESVELCLTSRVLLEY